MKLVIWACIALVVSIVLLIRTVLYYKGEAIELHDEHSDRVD